MKWNKIIDVLLTISVIVTVVLVMWFILGNSPTIDQIMVSFLTGLFLYLLNQGNKLNNKIHKTREYMLKEFHKMQLDIKEIKVKVSHIEEKIT